MTHSACFNGSMTDTPTVPYSCTVCGRTYRTTDTSVDTNPMLQPGYVCEKCRHTQPNRLPVQSLWAIVTTCADDDQPTVWGLALSRDGAERHLLNEVLDDSSDADGVEGEWTGQMLVDRGDMARHESGDEVSYTLDLFDPPYVFTLVKLDASYLGLLK